MALVEAQGLSADNGNVGTNRGVIYSFCSKLNKY